MADNAGFRALDIYALFGVLAQIPTRVVTEMRKQRMDAGLDLLPVEDVFSLVIFLSDSVVAIDGHSSKGIAVCCDAVTENEVVACVENEQERQQREGDDEKRSSHRVPVRST